jgi:hypothetical protein
MSRQWGELALEYPKAKFQIYEDPSISSALKLYSASVVPYLLLRYFTDFPELEQKVIYQCDSDIIFLKKPDVEHLLQDDVCYLSDTNSYISTDYILGKVNDVSPEKKEAFKKIDVLKGMCDIVKIDKQIPIDNKEHSGGAQYLLKNMTAAMWQKIFTDSLLLKMYLSGINRRFFKKATAYQDWTAGMWSYLYNLWYFNKTVKVVPEMDFTWPVYKIGGDYSVLHNAGVTSSTSIRTTEKNENGENVHVDAPTFYKSIYADGRNPYDDMDYLLKVINHPISKEYNTSVYVNYLLKYKNKLSPILNIK